MVLIDELSQTLYECPGHIHFEHWQEWIDSCVDPEIIASNVMSWSGEAAYHLLGSENMKRLNTGRLATYWLRRYRHIEEGGWWFGGLDPLTGERMAWGCFKPNQPYIHPDGKPQKYEHPYGSPTRVFFAYNPNKPEWAEQMLNDPTLAITITEGAKKAGCLMSAGYPTIGLPGITGAVRKDESSGVRRYYLIDDVKAFCLPERRVYILFDHDTKPSAQQAVIREIHKLAMQLKSCDCEPWIVTLPGPEKGVDDFVAARGVEALHQLYADAMEYDRWLLHKGHQLTHPVAQQLSQRYLGKFEPPKSARLIVVKSPKGTGKTCALAKLIREGRDEGRRTISLHHRNSLAREMANAFDIPHVEELRTAEEGRLLGYTCCVDSLVTDSQAMFTPEGWHTVVMDEAMQVIWHLLDAKTEIKDRRLAVLNNLQELFRDVLTKEGGRLVLMDADMSDIGIEFVLQLAGVEVEPYIIQNDWIPEEEAWNVTSYDATSPEALIADFLEYVSVKGNRAVIFTQAQRAQSLTAVRNLETLTQETVRNLETLTQEDVAEILPDLKTLAIDSHSVSDPGHPAYGCMDNLDKVLEQYDVVFCSPTIETGVSIDLKRHFGRVYGIFTGVTSEATVRQTLARVREPIDRHIWVKKTGFGRVGNGSTSAKSLWASEDRATSWHIQQFKRFLLEPDATLTTNKVALQTWVQMGAIINAGMAHYREAVIAGLAAEGHRITTISNCEPNPELKERIRAVRDRAFQQFAEAVATAEDIEPSKYEELQKNKHKTEAEHNQQYKYFLQERYCKTPVTDELVKRDQQGWFPKIRLHYYLTAFGKPFLIEREKQTFQGSIYQQQVWSPELNRKMLGKKLVKLCDLGVMSLLNPEETFHDGHPLIVEIVSRWRLNPWGVKDDLGISQKPEERNIPLVQRLLALLGLKLTYIGRPGKRGEARKRLYKFVSPDDGRFEVFGRWAERDEMRRLQAESATVSTPGI